MFTRQTARRATRQASAFGLAAVLTLSLLGSIDQLATPAAAPEFSAATGPTTQVVVIEGKRIARS